MTLIASNMVEELRVSTVSNENVQLRVVVKGRTNVIDESTQLQIITKDLTVFGK